MIASARVTTVVTHTPFAFTFGTAAIHGTLRFLGFLATRNKSNTRDQGECDDAAAFDGALIFHLMPLGQKYEGFPGMVPNTPLEI
jgi:hypothetical protein